MTSISNTLNEIKENWVQKHFDEQQRDLFIETLYGRDVKYCLETGFCTGASSTTVLATVKPEKMISVGLDHNNMKIAGQLTDQYNFQLVVGDSTRILNDEFMNKEFPNGIDFYHVDGGHEGPVPLHDLNACVDYLNDNFLIIVDDFHSKICPLPDVDAAVETFIQKTNFKLKPVTTESGKGMAFITA